MSLVWLTLVFTNTGYFTESKMYFSNGFDLFFLFPFICPRYALLSVKDIIFMHIPF